MPDPLILYFESPEFVAYHTAYNLALEAEAERILVYRSHGLHPLECTTQSECLAARDKQSVFWEESQRLLAICRSIPEHKVAFGY